MAALPTASPPIETIRYVEKPVVVADERQALHKVLLAIEVERLSSHPSPSQTLQREREGK